ncbi:MAG: class I SAM-dependent methyltransferase [Flavobacteriales bacterium]|nr:class I SAM-dependent methyltransferase [Flavobacteriales bacterium]
MEHSLETLNACPSCGTSGYEHAITSIDYTYSKYPFEIVACESCQLLFTNPRPTEDSIGAYYDNPEYVSHTDTKTGLLFRLYRIVKSFTLKQKRLLLQKHTKQRTVLDYGAGSGDFSVELASHGWSVEAFEPDSKARTLIIEKDSRIRIATSLDDITKQSKSVITLWHVLEHVHKLQETIGHFHRILDDDGLLIIAVPNHTSFDARFYKKNWAAYDVPRHLYHFDITTIETLMARLGFRLKTIKPMWFDSYYVSLLSEKNASEKNGTTTVIRWIRAIYVGTISNLYALNKTSRCSSVTYIFEKSN